MLLSEVSYGQKPGNLDTSRVVGQSNLDRAGSTEQVIYPTAQGCHYRSDWVTYLKVELSLLVPLWPGRDSYGPLEEKLGLFIWEPPSRLQPKILWPNKCH